MSPRGRQFEHEGKRWRVVRTGVETVTSPEGHFPKVDAPGLRFTSDTGDHRFLKLSYTEVPTQHDLEEMSQDKLVEYLSRARPES